MTFHATEPLRSPQDREAERRANPRAYAMRYGFRDEREPKRETITRWRREARDGPQEPVQPRRRDPEQEAFDRAERDAIERRKGLARRLAHARTHPNEVSWDEFLDDVAEYERAHRR